jgi:glycosyltransferase involved in cell wall biosynthesis
MKTNLAAVLESFPRPGCLEGFHQYEPMRFIAIQNGARRGYAVPAILERAGMLERFYTDLCGNVGLGRGLSRGRHLPFIGSRLARLGARELPEDIIAKTYSFGSAAAQASFFELLGSKVPERKFRRRIKMAAIHARAMIRQGFGNATHIYSMFREGGDFQREAHRRGLTVISEIYIPVSAEGLIAYERQIFPDWEPEAPDFYALRRRFVDEDVVMTRTDFYMCPSEFVRDDLVKQWGVPLERTMMVPYGMNPNWLTLKSGPQRGRLLFAGTAELRKGIHYLAMAAEKLLGRGLKCEFRVAGNVTDQVRRQPLCRHLNFLGRVPRANMAREFEAADVLVLPSLAEGSAEVTYEALACGLPIITTHAAGSVVRDGIEGCIVPERDPEALAAAIRELVEDRQKRDLMADAARDRAREYTWGKYGERLVMALKSLPSRNANSRNELTRN